MPKKLTTESFIDRAQQVHGDLYSYDKTIYVNASTDIVIICPVHGEFKQRAANHINAGSGCPSCAGNIQKDNTGFISAAQVVHGNTYDYSKVQYVNAGTPVTIICPVHGEFNQSFKLHVTLSCGCPSCKGDRVKSTMVERYGQCNAMAVSEFREKRDATNTKRYGTIYPSSTDTVKQKIVTTNIKKYGTRAAAAAGEVRSKITLTNIKRYGVSHPWSSSIVRENIKSTIQLKYGVPNSGQSDELKQKKQDTIRDRYGVDHFSQHHISEQTLLILNDKEQLYRLHVIDKLPLVEIAKLLQVSDGTVGRYLHAHGYDTTIFSSSVGEREIGTFVSDCGVDIITNNRSLITPLELDVYVPSHQIAIEYCGLYWHSDEVRGNTYHADKLRRCNEAGIELFTVFEDEWQTRQPQIKAKLRHALGVSDKLTIYPRECAVQQLSSHEVSSFFDVNHIQGNGPGSIVYCLVFEGAIVAAMKFINKKNDVFTLSRYATGARIPGGFTKLLTHFQRTHNWSKIESFADLRWSSGDLYQSNGWQHEYTIPPDYYWCYGGRRYHKFAFRHNSLVTKLKTYDPALSETQNCRANGYYKIFDCGKMKFCISNL